LKELQRQARERRKQNYPNDKDEPDYPPPMQRLYKDMLNKIDDAKEQTGKVGEELVQSDDEGEDSNRTVSDGDESTELGDEPDRAAEMINYYIEDNLTEPRQDLQESSQRVSSRLTIVEYDSDDLIEVVDETEPDTLSELPPLPDTPDDDLLEPALSLQELPPLPDSPDDDLLENETPPTSVYNRLSELLQKTYKSLTITNPLNVVEAEPLVSHENHAEEDIDTEELQDTTVLKYHSASAPHKPHISWYTTCLNTCSSV
jgi:hypothetical protein